jgi:catechol 2,3-dioxygenase-like lactoylglutathione lyase family enzyme
MIEHTTIYVTDYNQAKEFYSSVLEPLGYKLNMEHGPAAGFMADGHTSFWIMEKPTVQPGHVAFGAKTRESVNKFYDLAIAGGAKDNGAPGLRSDYSPDYYAAFILDTDGNNIEAVCFN